MIPHPARRYGAGWLPRYAFLRCGCGSAEGPMSIRFAREAEGLLRSAQAEDRRSAYDALAIKGAKDSRDRARWHLEAANVLADIKP
jgi:hypothetical protein